MFRAIKMEEERFHQTLRSGMNIVNEIVERMKKNGETEISGTDLFMLYDTYGFPIDLSKDVADENGFTVDETGFNKAMEEQRQKSQSARAEAGGEDQAVTLGQRLVDVPVGRFLGYEQPTTVSHITAICPR